MRALKVAVVLMGVMILVGIVALVVLLALRASGPSTPTSAVLSEPEGTRIMGASSAGDRMTLQLSGGGPDRVVVLDLRSGRVVARAGLAH